MRNWRKSLIS